MVQNVTTTASTTTRRIEATRTYRAADVIPGSINEADRTVNVVWTTGERVKRYSWFDGPWMEELSTDPAHVRMERLQSGRAPVLLQHNSWDPEALQGVVMTAAMENGQGTATLRFLKGDPEADKTWNKIVQRVLVNISVGYDIHKMELVEGGDETTPVYRATDWEPYEISPVSIGAGKDSHIRSGGAESRNAPTNTCTIITHTRAAPAQPPKEQSRMGAENQQTPTTPAPTPVIDTDAVLKAERARVSSIRELATKHKLGDEFIRTHTDSGAGLDAVRAAALEAMVAREAQTDTATPARVTVGDEARDKQFRAESSWLIERTGFSQLIEDAKSKPVFARAFPGGVTIDSGPARGLSLMDLARSYLERNGVRTAGMSKMDLAGRALSFRSPGMHTTGDFPVLFEDALRKILLAAYAMQSDTWRLFCGTDTVPDFRPSPRYRTGEMGGTLDKLSEHGEYKSKSIPDGSKSEISTETRGNMVALTRELLINDDMGALADLGAKFGRLTGRSIEVDVYALLALNGGLGPTLGDGKTFFHADRGNLGTGSALGAVGLSADKRLMRRQKDANGVDYIDLRPQTLLLSDALEDEANQWNDSEFDPVANNLRKPNAVRGLFTKIVGSPRIDGTRRYLFADPASGAVSIKVVFLEGQGEAPVLEMQDGWRTDGVEWKIRSDFKVQAFDPKGAVTNAGA